MLIAPTGGAIDMSLSFRITINFDFIAPALFMASYAIPALMAPSPITATTLFLSFESFFAVAIPKVDDIEVELCAAPNGSYSLSALLVKPDNPPPLRKVLILSFLPVIILCG